MVLPKSMRLKGHRCFNHLHKTGRRYHGSLMLLKVAAENKSSLRFSKENSSNDVCKFAVAISNKVSKKAVIRNKLRRIIHSHLTKKLSKATFNQGKWALISLKPTKIPFQETKELILECDRLLKNAGLVK